MTDFANGARYWARSISSWDSFSVGSVPVAIMNAAATERDLLSFRGSFPAVSTTISDPPTFADLASLSASWVIGPGLLNSGSEATTSALRNLL